jgi:hypothetical protein
VPKAEALAVKLCVTERALEWSRFFQFLPGLFNIVFLHLILFCDSLFVKFYAMPVQLISI